MTDHLLTKKEIRNDVAAVLSLLPGAGHLYKGYAGIGVLFLACTPVVLFCALLMALGTFGIGTAVLIALYWGAAAAHAWRIPPKHHHPAHPRAA